MKVLDVKYGIEITRPWNPAMYDHNDKVAELMKVELLMKLEFAHVTEDEGLLRDVAKIIYPVGYGDGFEFEDIYVDARKNLERVENWWLNEEYPYAVKKGIVPALEQEMVGYSK